MFKLKEFLVLDHLSQKESKRIFFQHVIEAVDVCIFWKEQIFCGFFLENSEPPALEKDVQRRGQFG
jgi:hypothetical protein